jgi:hypothetical protein
MDHVIETDVLKELRKVGDPLIDGLGPRPSGMSRHDHMVELRQVIEQAPAYTAAACRDASSQHAADIRAFAAAQELFARYSTEICAALLLAALPQTYATRWGPQVLVATGGLVTDVRRRVQGTAEYLVDVLMPEPATSGREATARPWARAATASVTVRCVHHAIRVGVGRIGGEGNDVPLNQEDLLGTLLTFTVTVFEVLERFGITWTREEQEAYLLAWDKVGDFLGVGDETVVDAVREATGRPRDQILPPGWTTLRPPSVPAARAMMDAFRRRQWTPVEPWTGRALEAAPLSAEWESLVPGRQLTAALVDELSASMTPRMRALPSMLIRALAAPVVRDRLALGGGGFVQALVDNVPRRRVRLDGFTAATSTSQIGGPVMRQLANHVVRRSFIHFMQSDARLPLAALSAAGRPGLLAAR